MPGRCPLSSYSARGFAYQEDISETCLKSCEKLWDAAVRAGAVDHEEYPDYILTSPDCSHPDTEYGGSSLQAVALNSSVRIYSITEKCLSCDEEIAEDNFYFQCPNQ